MTTANVRRATPFDRFRISLDLIRVCMRGAVAKPMKATAGGNLTDRHMAAVDALRHEVPSRRAEPSPLFEGQLVVAVISRSRRITEDLSVIGVRQHFRRKPFGSALTTVAQPPPEMGRVATRSLAQLISNDVVGTRHIERYTALAD
jgi:hypothetical protein